MGELPPRIDDYLESANIALSVSLAAARGDPLFRVNPAFCSMTGYRADEVEGRNCRFLQRHLTGQPAVARMREFLADPARPRVRVTLINFRADGTPFVNMLTLSRLSSGGEARFILGTQFDITAAAPSELLDYDEELRHLAAPRASIDRDMFLGSAHSMAEAATAILQARLLLEDAEHAGLLV